MALVRQGSTFHVEHRRKFAILCFTWNDSFTWTRRFASTTRRTALAFDEGDKWLSTERRRQCLQESAAEMRRNRKICPPGRTNACRLINTRCSIRTARASAGRALRAGRLREQLLETDVTTSASPSPSARSASRRNTDFPRLRLDHQQTRVPAAPAPTEWPASRHHFRCRSSA